MRYGAAVVMVVVAAAGGGAARAEPACEALAALQLPDTSIEKVQAVHAGPYEARDVGGNRAIDLPAHCRVVGTIRPTTDSAIGFEVWLPTDHWNQKYRQEGNGGLAGSLNYSDLAGVLQAGYATAATDDGHRTTNGFDARWAIGHPEKLIDYGSRAVHRTALVGQAIVAAYYGRKARYNYFIGCSGGGRESLMEAQRYPEDFDGYLAGSPGIDIPGNGIAHVHLARALAALGPDGQLTASQLHALSAKALERCDAADGIKDGVVRDPRKCTLTARELICRGPSDGFCLTPAQATAVQSIYDGLKDPATGAQLEPGWSGTLGAEDTTWPPAVPLIRNLVSDQNYLNVLLYGRTERDTVSLDLTQAARDIRKVLGPTINADNPDLRAARRAGKRILQFHGWPDSAVLAQYSVDYFEAVQKFMGSDTGDFYRLFMVPGMAHCGGGVGPTIYFSGPRGPDSLHEWVAALEAWVEHGTAPDRIIATEYDTSGLPPGPFGGGVAIVPADRAAKRTRPLCPYPQVAVLTNRARPDDEASFSCRRL